MLLPEEHGRGWYSDMERREKAAGKGNSTT